MKECVSEEVNETEIAKRMRVEQIHVRLLHSQMNDRKRATLFHARESARGKQLSGNPTPTLLMIGE